MKLIKGSFFWIDLLIVVMIRDVRTINKIVWLYKLVFFGLFGIIKIDNKIEMYIWYINYIDEGRD